MLTRVHAARLRSFGSRLYARFGVLHRKGVAQDGFQNAIPAESWMGDSSLHLWRFAFTFVFQRDLSAALAARGGSGLASADTRRRFNT